MPLLVVKGVMDEGTMYCLYSSFLGQGIAHYSLVKSHHNKINVSGPGPGPLSAKLTTLLCLFRCADWTPASARYDWTSSHLTQPNQTTMLQHSMNFQTALPSVQMPSSQQLPKASLSQLFVAQTLDIIVSLQMTTVLQIQLVLSLFQRFNSFVAQE